MIHTLFKIISCTSTIWSKIYSGVVILRKYYTAEYLSAQTPIFENMDRYVQIYAISAGMFAVMFGYTDIIFFKDKGDAFESAAKFLKYEEIWLKNSINILIDLCNNEDTTRQDMVIFMKRVI